LECQRGPTIKGRKKRKKIRRSLLWTRKNDRSQTKSKAHATIGDREGRCAVETRKIILMEKKKGISSPIKNPSGKEGRLKNNEKTSKPRKTPTIGMEGGELSGSSAGRPGADNWK